MVFGAIFNSRFIKSMKFLDIKSLFYYYFNDIIIYIINIDFLCFFLKLRINYTK